MASITVTKPVRADHRLITRLLDMSKGKYQQMATEYDRISSVFQKAGGSWEKLFKGSVDDLSLLKKAIKVAIAKGYVTKKDME